MPPKKVQDPQNQVFKAYPIPDPISQDTAPPSIREFKGYDEFLKGHLGLDRERLANAMDVVSDQHKKNAKFDGLFVATKSMKSMASVVGALWSLNCYKDESDAKGNHTFYTCVGITPNNEKSVLGLSVMGPESQNNWLYFLSNLKKSHEVLNRRNTITFMSDGRPEIVAALNEIMPVQRQVVCSRHKYAQAEGEMLNSEFCEQSCADQVDYKSRPMVVGMFRTVEQQREVAVRCNAATASRLSENQFRMSMEVINENLNRRGVKPAAPSWSGK